MIVFSIFSSAFAQATVTVTGTDLSPTFSPGTSSPIVSLSFVIVGSPIINKIQVDRTGTATNTDVPSAKLYRDVNKNNIVDGGDVQLDQTRFFNTATPPTLYFQALNYSPSSTENLLIVFDVAAGANTSNTAGASIPAGYITGGNLTTVVYTGTTTGNQPLPVELTSFSAQIQNKSVILEWKTATEVNNYGFDVERLMTNDLMTNDGGSHWSLVNGHWEKIGFVEGHGNSNSPKSYTFTDNLALARLASGNARQAHNLNLARLQYRLKQIDFDGSYKYSDVVKLNVDTPSEYTLGQNFPNPFNPTTVISYQLPEAENVSLKVYDVLGKEVATIVDKFQQAGVYNSQFSISNYQLSSGIYFYTLRTKDFVKTKKMLILK